MSRGVMNDARQYFQEALPLLEEPTMAANDGTLAYHETRSNLYLYTGQLCMEQEALQAYQSGIQSLETCLDIAMDEETEKTLRQKLSGAYCTVAELYLTDLCYDVDGEPLVDALQTMASLRLSQKNRQEEAVPFILRAYDKMKTGCEALATLVGLGDDDNDAAAATMVAGEAAVELKEVDAANNLPEFELRPNYCWNVRLFIKSRRHRPISRCLPILITIRQRRG